MTESGQEHSQACQPTGGMPSEETVTRDLAPRPQWPQWRKRQGAPGLMPDFESYYLELPDLSIGLNFAYRKYLVTATASQDGSAEGRDDAKRQAIPAALVALEKAICVLRAYHAEETEVMS